MNWERKTNEFKLMLVRTSFSWIQACFSITVFGLWQQRQKTNTAQLISGRQTDSRVDKQAEMLHTCMYAWGMGCWVGEHAHEFIYLSFIIHVCVCVRQSGSVGRFSGTDAWQQLQWQERSRLCGGEMEHEEQNKQADGYVGVGCEVMAPALQRGIICEPVLCQSLFLIVLCGFECMWLPKWAFMLTSRLKMTSQSESVSHGALPSPIPCSSNLQMTLGIPSTSNESLPTWCDLFNPAERLGYKSLRWKPWSGESLCVCVCRLTSMPACMQSFFTLFVYVHASILKCVWGVCDEVNYLNSQKQSFLLQGEAVKATWALQFPSFSLHHVLVLFSQLLLTQRDFF